jgi:hypothetical protein
MADAPQKLTAAEQEAVEVALRVAAQAEAKRIAIEAKKAGEKPKGPQTGPTELQKIQRAKRAEEAAEAAAAAEATRRDAEARAIELQEAEAPSLFEGGRQGQLDQLEEQVGLRKANQSTDSNN